MEGIALLLPVENAMAEPEKFPEVLRNSCIGLDVLLSSFSTLGYVTFGTETADLITLNLPPSDKVVVLMQVLYSVSLFFTYPLMML
jgi:proton-coupled amino acid transporter